MFLQQHLLQVILIITIFSKSSQISTYTEENERLRSDISAKEAQRRTLSDEMNNLQKDDDAIDKSNRNYEEYWLYYSLHNALLWVTNHELREYTILHQLV